jgi:hypothetical protein
MAQPRKIEILSEGNTGILEYREQDGPPQQFIPFYDLDATRELLLEFQDLKDSRGVALKDNYIVDGRDWFPSAVSWLYWHVFYAYVKYQPLVDRKLRGEIEVAMSIKGEFSDFLSILERGTPAPRWKLELLHALIGLQNRRVLKKHRHPVMFYRFAREDFRSVEILRVLRDVAGNYVEAVPCPNFRQVLDSLKNNEPVYYYAAPPAARRFAFEYDLGGLSPEKRALFAAAVDYVEVTLSKYVREWKRHNQWLAGTAVKTFYGFDDVNGYCMPLLLAAKDHGIRTVAHQHGAYVKRHAGYIMEGIDPARYEWFDRLIVWGQYWKDKLQRDSKVHANRDIVVGANKFKWDYSSGKGVVAGRKNVLVPYEFLTNTHAVGKFITVMIDSGYSVFFKPRADEDPADQLRSYCLPEETLKKVSILEKLTPDAMSQIDIIAATMTTLVYELLPYEKIVWILECEYKHLYDLVEEGYAHSISLNDFPEPPPEKWTPCRIPADYLFSSISMQDTLRDAVKPNCH